jgi:hypothetical protein
MLVLPDRLAVTCIRRERGLLLTLSLYLMVSFPSLSWRLDVDAFGVYNTSSVSLHPSLVRF